jgi:WD40 repeat protein
MSDMTPNSQFEEEIRAAVAAPLAREEFIKSLHGRIVQQAAAQPKLNRPILFRPAWIAACVLALLIFSILVVGPQRVLAAMRGLFGYIPGVGIVDQSAPFRVLAEPVSVTRDGISITVTSALLTGEKTHIEYRIFGVPGSAYPNREDMMGCTTPEYLRLPDGSRIDRIDNDYGPIPTGIDAATFVMPCIFNTLPGKTPENWELPLRFVPAPPDLTVMPVIDLSPSPQASPTPETTALPEAVGATPTSPVNNQITIIKEIETGDGYILVGQFPFQGLPREQVTNGEAEIRDASGKKVAFTAPQDIGPNALGLDPNGPYWFMQFKATGLAYPLNFKFSGAAIQQADPNATVQFTFDAGSNPQPGQEWTPNQDIQLAGHTLKLSTIRADSRSGYNFSFQGDPKVISADIQIDGFTPTGHGWGRGLNAGGFDTSLSFTRFPTGVLTVTLSNLTVAGETLTWQGQWSPSTPRTDLPTNQTPIPGLCLAADSLTRLQPAPPALSNGKALVYEKLDTGKWGLVLYALDGSQKQVVVTNGNWGALSPDGSKVVYSALDNGIHLVDVNTMTEQVIQNASGFDIQWSPDGTQIAYIGMGNGAVNSAFIAKVDGSMVHQVSNLSYETIVGWSPDGGQLYFAAPFTGGAAWKVYSYDIASGSAQERFTIENGTPKFLNPKLSPDGNWIAYRGKDNSSLYLVHPDGSDMHLVLDNVGAAGIEWSRSGWLGVSISNPNSTESTFVLLKPDACEAYLLPATQQGQLEGLFIP